MGRLKKGLISKTVHVDKGRLEILLGRYGGLQEWVNLVMEEEFSNSGEAVIVEREEITEDDF